ncbi:MAG: hypothetical protein A2W01_00600 [Candidatus Solincola sediminis]|nr:MAG: hypothetical protein A2W01_00600 [Candidatus Solincola sediminis]
MPLLVSRGLDWNENGSMTLAMSPMERMVFFESDTIDNLFRGVEKLIGIPIGHLVIESRARETKRYIERTFPPKMRNAAAFKYMTGHAVDPSITREERETHLAAIKNITQIIINISRIYGYGDQRLSNLWETDGDYPWRTQVIRNPYSVLFIAADNIGSVEVFEETDMRVEYEAIEEDTYKIEVRPGTHLVALKERLKRKRYSFKPGDISYDRCPQCGAPAEAASPRWSREDGTYTDPVTGRRMAIFGPSSMDSVLSDLELELGESIPETIIEAQRQYVKEAWGGERWNRAASDFRKMLALRGLGNLVEFEGDRNHLTQRIQNACLHLPVIGMTQALVELAYSVESSTHEWELADDGDLNITIIVR